MANGINYATGAAYNAGGALTSVLLGQSGTFGGITLAQGFNSRGQPTSIQASSSNGVAVDFTYSFDADPGAGVINNGNVVSIANNRDTSRSQSFTYDELNRVKTAQSQAASGPNSWGLQFGYDIWANLLSASVTKGSAPMLSQSVGTNNRLSGYSYDAAGNMLSDGSYSYTWDAESRMKTAAGVTYTYDGDGKRVKKSNGKLYWYGGGSDPLMETDLAGNNPDEYIFFGGKRIARRQSSGTVNYYFADHLGSSRVVTSATGTILDDADFYPFGGERAIASTSGNAYKFTGKERDSESNLDYFGARYYSPQWGRFLTVDPSRSSARLIDPQSWNRYSYVLNNPLFFIDPDGQAPMDFIRAATQFSEFLSDLYVGRQTAFLSGTLALSGGVALTVGGAAAAMQGALRLTAEAGIGVVAGTRLLGQGGVQALFGLSLLGLSVDLVRQSMELQEQVQAQANVFLSRMEHLLQPDELAQLSTEELQGTLSQLRQVSNSAAAGLLTRKQDIRLLMVIQGVEDEIRRREEEERKEKERKKKEEEEIP